MKTRVLLSFLALVGVAHAQTVPTPPATLPAAAETQAPFFPDVPPGHWAFAAVQKLAGAGIVQGFPRAATLPTVAANPSSIATVTPEQMAALERAAAVTPRVKTALGANVGLKGTLINVDAVSQTSTLTLKGTVKTQAQKQLAFAIARKNALAFKVVDQLRVSR